MSAEADFKNLVKANGWETVELTGDDPIEHMLRCQWALEIGGVDLDVSTIYQAEYHRRILGADMNRFPLVLKRLLRNEQEFKATLRSINDTTVKLNCATPFNYLVGGEFSLEFGMGLDAETHQRVLNAFPQVKFAVQAFPRLAQLFGISGGPTYNPRAAAHAPSGDPTVVPLPQQLADRMPAGHSVRRFTGTMEFVQGNNNTGQRNFYLAPIRGEEEMALQFAGNERFGVTDLPIEQFNGHKVVLFCFTGPSRRLGFFLCYSRSSDAWLTLHNQSANIFLFDQPKAGTGTAVNILTSLFVGPALGKIAGEAHAEKNRALSAGETHVLILDIRQYLESIMDNGGAAAPPPPPQFRL